jgi:glycosyltransferase involved in cell wall biosynthesis
MLYRQANAELATGRVPLRLRDAIEALLDVADSFVRKKDMRRSAAALSKAMMLAAHRVLHFDRLSSPLADDPDGFLAPFRRSQAARALESPRGRTTPPGPPPRDRPLRLLFATLINDNFLSEIRQRYENMPGVEIRFLDLNEGPGYQWLSQRGVDIIEHALGGPSSFASEIDDWLRPSLEWADTVFIDWCLSPAAMFTVNDPGPTRIIIRLHSMEVFSLWPHLVDFSRVDDVVFVSDHLRDLSTVVLPRLAGPDAPRQRVISNAMDLQRFRRPKPDSARFNLGMVGISSVAKDPRWALDVLRLLRQQDPRYRLLLIGSDLSPTPSQAARQYHRLLRRDYAELEPSGAVQRLGKTSDVPAALEAVGVILSTSVRESFHCGLVEGAASGAVPVVRDWPYFARLPHGARTLFPPDWVVETPEEAAKRILYTTATVDGWRAAGQAASDHAIGTWDWSTTQREFDELLLGPLPAKNR